MADYSNTMLATVTSLQKRQKPPKIAYQRALLSNLYPFYHFEKSDITVDNGVTGIVDTSNTSKENSNISFNLSFEFYEALKEYTPDIDSIENKSTFDISVDVNTLDLETFVTINEGIDFIENKSSFDLQIVNNIISFINITPEDDMIENIGSFDLQITT